MSIDINTSWDKLDNTALLFPVIASENMTNVYRIFAVMTEDVDRVLLQEALNRVLPHFSVFRMCLRAGMFWYYFEENRKTPPQVRQEYAYPGAYINKSQNHNYMFRVTYYGRRINLEVFHVLTDGFGGIVFLKELVYQYLRLKYPDELAKEPDRISSDVYFDKEDSYLKNYKKPVKERKKYKSSHALTLQGEKLMGGAVGVIQGSMRIDLLKAACKKYGVTINQYLVGAFTYAIYKGYLHNRGSDVPIACCVPVNLRPFYDSHTMKNFFAMVTAEFQPEERLEKYSFAEVLAITTDSLKEQITKENLDDIITYNVSNEQNFILRLVPLALKNIAIKQVYEASRHNSTTTITNIGNIELREPYRPYVENFACLLSMSAGQNMKGSVCSYNGILTVCFSSILSDTSVQKCFFQTLTADGVEVVLQTNDVYEDA
ncbi:MAG: hypothetical protein IJ147_05650 [Lachnospiraceae bacterium]|nr:hypothetical protein [Lachnospiraceae bacterium]